MALAYYIIYLLDCCLAWDATWRPLFAGWLTGLLLGDMKTGLVMGAQLEAVYMGISAIGGGHNAFGTTMVLAVFPELYAILGLLVLILIAGTLPAAV